MEVEKDPFFHTYLTDIFPEDFYAELKEYMHARKTPEDMSDRLQDNPGFVNRRYNLVADGNPAIRILRETFSDPEVKSAFLSGFYSECDERLLSALEIHKEFEFVYCEPGRFQNIHVDIPPKFMSFVFYFPDTELGTDDELKNATILYDRNLEPRYGARFIRNSVCVFVPHFYSYHGFSTTVDRDVLVMFYINGDELQRWDAAKAEDAAPFDVLKDATERKIRNFPLIEYGSDDEKIRRERNLCLVNAPRGRVIRS